MHFHTVKPNGLFSLSAPDKERASFIALPPPKTEEVERLLARVVKRVDDRPRARLEARSSHPATARQPCQVLRGFRALHGPGGEREARPTLLRPAPSCARWWCQAVLVQLRPQVALSS